jgi:peptidoglycan/LPS O-acetylase OafA/YrhL
MPSAESAKDIASLPHGRLSSSGSGFLQDACQQLDQAAAPASAKKASRPRTYYVDWLRGFLTVLVVLHHCVTAYQSSYAWAGKRGDTALWLLSQLFVGANQAYFMTLFFFLSGLYVPGSYRRKGPLHFLLDRTLRLVLPCIVYSFVAPPFILMWNELAKNPKANVGQAWGNAYRGWLKPGWPSTYVLPTGPVSVQECCFFVGWGCCTGFWVGVARPKFSQLTGGCRWA